MTRLEPEKTTLRRQLSRLGWETVRDILALQRADMGSKGTGKDHDFQQFDRIDALLEEIAREESCLTLRDLAVDGHDLIALGFRGQEIGTILNNLLEQVLEETLPNEREALLRSISKGDN